MKGYAAMPDDVVADDAQIDDWVGGRSPTPRPCRRRSRSARKLDERASRKAPPTAAASGFAAAKVSQLSACPAGSRC